MTKFIDSLAEIASGYDAIVLDQWGVLHDGTLAYPGAITILERLAGQGVRFAVLSNSGKRAAPNLERISGKGFDATLFDVVMTSGEALWQDIAAGRIAAQRFLPIERSPGDAATWANGLDISIVSAVDEADAILLMGLPDGVAPDAYAAVLEAAMARNLPVLCSNPDRASPRADGGTVVSPGALAHDHHDQGGHVTFYGKPHAPVFEAVASALGAKTLLMVGDSLEHDIAGGAAAGWDTLFIRGGLHAAHFVGADINAALAALVAEEASPAPTYSLEVLQ